VNLRSSSLNAALLALFCTAAPHALAEAPALEGGEDDIQQVIERYCVAISDAAAERRMATQSAALKELEARLEEKITRLEQKRGELETLLKRREDLRNLARKELIEIYAGMEPEAASAQLEKLDVRLSSSVLRQLKPRQASAILNEMSPEFAARMAKMIASAAQDRGDEQ
jgi:flagellar motility protein MotE (MotC chaperone)